MALAIIGTGITKFGELWDKNWEDLVLESSLEAIKNANIEMNYPTEAEPRGISGVH